MPRQTEKLLSRLRLRFGIFHSQHVAGPLWDRPGARACHTSRNRLAIPGRDSRGPAEQHVTNDRAAAFVQSSALQGNRRVCRAFGLVFPSKLSATAARMRSFNAASFIFSPSWMSMARLTFPSRLELNRPEGSFNAAPFANVILTTLLYVSPVQTIPP